MDHDDQPPHPLIQSSEILEESDIFGILDLPRPSSVEPEERPPLAPSRSYCESCGHVGGHGKGCPAEAAEAMALEIAGEDEADARELAARTPEPILPLVRRIGASLLRRAAGILAPENK